MAWLRYILLSLVLAMPALADPLPGADDPAFTTAFDSLLTRDELPAKLLDEVERLHAARVP